MARGGGGKTVFEDDKERYAWIESGRTPVPSRAQFYNDRKDARVSLIPPPLDPMKSLLPGLGLLAAFLLGACKPELCFWWSPKGDQAVVKVDDALHLVAADGELGQALPLEATAAASISCVAWRPDGSGVLVCRRRKVATWTEVKALVPTAESEAIEKLMPLVVPLLEWQTGIEESVNDAGLFDGLLQDAEQSKMLMALLALREKDSGRIDELLGRLIDDPDFAKGIDDAGFEVPELCLVTLNGPSGVQVSSRLRSLDGDFLMARFSPTRPVIALLRERAGETTLELLPIGDGAAVEIDRGVAQTFDWTPDGWSLVYAKHKGSADDPLHEIVEARVIGSSGGLEGAPGDGSAAPPAEPDAAVPKTTVATLLLPEHCQLRVLPDQRVLVASQAATYPEPEETQPQPFRPYLLSRMAGTIEPIAISHGQLPDDPSFFDVSPDGTRLAFGSPNDDAVTLVDVKTGETRVISPPHPHWKCRVMPAWKSNTELTFAGIDEGGTPRWMLWSKEGGIRPISGKWPDHATSKWLDHEESDADGTRP